MEDKIKINSYIDYNALVDNMNIAYLETPNHGIYKCFQMTPGIWVTPETKPHFHAVPYQLSSREIISCTQYLKNISFYFNRIYSHSMGNEFLQIVNQASPYKYYKEFYDDSQLKKKFKGKIASVFVMDQETQKKRIGTANLSLLIQPPRGDIRPSATRLRNHKTSIFSYKLAYGGIAIIRFSPNTIFKFNLKNRTHYFQDPMITLLHELIHGLHFIYDYDIIMDKVKINNFKYELEEIITHGGKKDCELLQESITELNQKYLKHVHSILNNLNESKKSKAFKDFYAHKYCLEKKEGKYELTSNSAKKLIFLLQEKFTEIKFCETIHAMERENYYDAEESIPYLFDPSDKKYYDPKDGLKQEEFKHFIENNNIKPMG